VRWRCKSGELAACGRLCHLEGGTGRIQPDRPPWVCAVPNLDVPCVPCWVRLAHDFGVFMDEVVQRAEQWSSDAAATVPGGVGACDHELACAHATLELLGVDPRVESNPLLHALRALYQRSPLVYRKAWRRVSDTWTHPSAAHIMILYTIEYSKLPSTVLASLLPLSACTRAGACNN
jgi:hypothetical protein